MMKLPFNFGRKKCGFFCSGVFDEKIFVGFLEVV